MKRLEKLTRKKLGEIMVAEGLISKTQLDDAEMEQRRTREPLGTILVDSSYIDEWDLARLVATQYQLPFVDLLSVQPDKDTVDSFDHADLAQWRLLPIGRFGKIVTLAAAEMPDLDILQRLSEKSGLSPYLFVAVQSDITRGLKEFGIGDRTEPDPVTHVGEESGDDDVALRELLSQNEPAFGVSRPDESQEEPAEEPGDDVAAIGSDRSWENIFDTANSSVLKDIDSE